MNQIQLILLVENFLKWTGWEESTGIELAGGIR